MPSSDPCVPELGDPGWAVERRRIVRDSLGVGIATGAYGVSFGALATASGLTIAQTCVLSLLMFTGASQFALVGITASGGGPVAGAATALLMGTRNTLYGLRMAPMLSWVGVKRLGAAHILIDESTAMAVTRTSQQAARVGFLTTGLSIFVLWNAATFLGAVGGEAMGDPRTYGLDAAVGAAYLALLWPRLRDPRNRVVAALGAAVALALVPVTRAGLPVLAAAVVALLVGVLSTRADPTEIPAPEDLPGSHR